MHSPAPNADGLAMDYRHASMSSTPPTPRAAPAGSTPAVATTSPSRQPSRQQPRLQPTEPTLSQIVDIALPSSLSAKTALQMVRTTVKSLMYMRGLLSTPWEQLEIIVKMDRQQQEEQEQDVLAPDHETLRARGTPSQSIKKKPSPMEPLQKFLEAGEKMFTTLEDTVYDQLYQHLKKTQTPQLQGAAFSDATTASLESMSSLPSPQPQVMLSLALIFGTTLSTPKEQYMIHIGPLKPQQPILNTTTSSLSATSSNDQASDENETDHERDMALRNQLQRMEREWERQLVRGLMGIRIIDDSTTASSAQESPHQQQQEQFLDASTAVLPKTKVLLLMKAKSGQIIEGMLPKLALDLQEDFAPEFSSTAPPSSSSSSTSASTTSKTTERLAQKKKRWPIHHIRVMGPRPETLPDDGQDDDIWYQVGPGLPTMPSLK